MESYGVTTDWSQMAFWHVVGDDEKTCKYRTESHKHAGFVILVYSSIALRLPASQPQHVAFPWTNQFL